jgi:hypothetical protein
MTGQHRMLTYPLHPILPSYLSEGGGRVSVHFDFVFAFLDYDDVLHDVSFAILYLKDK